MSRRMQVLRRGDDGLVTTVVVAVVAVAIVALLFLAVIPLLSGTEQSSRTQTSADAAALAGARDVRDLALAELGSVLTPVGGVTFAELLGPARGFGSAQAYAADNGADVVEYRYDAYADEITVLTRLRETADNGRRAEARATASVGVELARCGLDRSQVIIGYEPPPEPEPEPEPEPPAPGEPDPEPEPPAEPEPEPEPVPIYGDEFRFRCPGFDSGTRSDLGEVLGAARGWLESALAPRLVQ